MEETDHKIDFQFQITMEWRENKRVVFHKLKQDTSLNALWLPVLIYDNTDQKEVTRLGMPYKWATDISVMREGSFTVCENNPGCSRSKASHLDELEIFEAKSSRIIMQQVYTWQFQCPYQLKHYPFDTQVNAKFVFYFARIKRI